MARKVQPVDILPDPSSSSEDGSTSSSTDDAQPPQSEESDDETEDDEPEPEPEPIVKKQQPQESEEESDDDSDSDSDSDANSDDDEPEPEPESIVKKQQPQESEEESDFDSDSDETQNSPSAFTVKPILPKPKTPTEPEKTDNKAKTAAAKPVSKNQEPGKVIGGNSKRPATEKIDKLVSKNKKSKVSNGDDGQVDKGSNGDEEGGEIGEKKSILTPRNDSKVKSSKKKDNKDGNVVSNTITPLEPLTNRELFVQGQIKDTIMEDKKEETQDFWSLYPRLCASLESEASNYLTMKVRDLKEYVKKIISGMGEEKARELEEGWEAIYVMDHQFYAKRAHLIKKQAEVVFDTLKPQI